MATSYISRNQSSNGSGKLTISVWLKHCEAAEQLVVTSYYSGDYWGDLRFLSDGAIKFQDYRNSYIFQLETTAKFLDSTSWYHVVVNFDNTLASPTGKIYVNGVLQDLATTNQYSQNETSSFLTDYTLNIGTYNSGSNWNGSMADLYYIQGQVYEASTFGSINSTSGEWKPNPSPTIDYSSTGNNSFHMKFEDASNLDLDSGGNNLTFSTTGSPTQTLDCPSNNFATWNKEIANMDTLTNGNTTVARSASSFRSAFSTIALPSTGKFYCEFKRGSGNLVYLGIADDKEGGCVDLQNRGQESQVGANANSVSYLASDGRSTINNTADTSYGASFSSSNVIGMAIDMTNMKLYFSKDGVFQNSGVPTSGSTGTGALAIPTTTGTYFVAAGFNASGVDVNFGNGTFGTTVITSAGTGASTPGTFEYDVPTGYQPLTTKGLNV